MSVHSSSPCVARPRGWTSMLLWCLFVAQLEVGSAGASVSGGKTTSVADQSAGLLRNWRKGPPRCRAGGSDAGAPEA
eukprot:1906980-Pyramimonas_sp.AAC.1